MYLMILHHNLQKAEKFKFENQDIFENAVDKKKISVQSSDKTAWGERKI